MSASERNFDIFRQRLQPTPRAIWEKLLAAERERCARIVEAAAAAWGIHNRVDLRRIAAEIRTGKGE